MRDFLFCFKCRKIAKEKMRDPRIYASKQPSGNIGYDFMIFCYASEFGNSIEDHFQVVLSPLAPNFTYNLPPWAWYDIPAVEKPAFPGSIA